MRDFLLKCRLAGFMWLMGLKIRLQRVVSPIALRYLEDTERPDLPLLERACERSLLISEQIKRDASKRM